MKTILNLNLFKLLKTKYTIVTKMMPLPNAKTKTVNKVGAALKAPLWMNKIMSHGRLGGILGYSRRTYTFGTWFWKTIQNHGASYTIKLLKAFYVSMMKHLAHDGVRSLRVLLPDLPVPGMKSSLSVSDKRRIREGVSIDRSRLPKIIPLADRIAIRNGDIRIIRFWAGLFNLYRVFQIPGNMKMNTITDSFSGDVSALNGLIKMINRGSLNFFEELEGVKSFKPSLIAPTHFFLGRKSSPSNPVSLYGVLTDVRNLRGTPLYGSIKSYLHIVGATEFLKRLTWAESLVDLLHSLNGYVESLPDCSIPGVKSGHTIAVSNDGFAEKPSVQIHGYPSGTGGVSQFAIKEEPAGKVRLFAMCDNITQSVLAPLHDYLFGLLKELGTKGVDGTFDQAKSIRRGQDLAVLHSCAYSFDLSSATDRIPVALSEAVLDSILGSYVPNLAAFWRLIIVDQRAFALPANVAEKWGVATKAIKYAVGQPMGALTSWAMLAITHHFMVQLAALRAGHKGFFYDYIIVGDDLVIFNHEVAKSYLVLCHELGVDINLNKSISSSTRPVFEFCKRVCVGHDVVSGISPAQVMAGWRVSGRVANLLNFVENGLITSPSLVLATLARFHTSRGKSLLIRTKSNLVSSQKNLSLGLLSLLGILFRDGKVSLTEFAHSLANPKIIGKSEEHWNELTLPVQGCAKLAFEALQGTLRYKVSPYSQFNLRCRVEGLWKRFLGLRCLFEALGILDRLNTNYEKLIHNGIEQIWGGVHYDNYYPSKTVTKVIKGKPLKVEVSTILPVPVSDYPPEILFVYNELRKFYVDLIRLPILDAQMQLGLHLSCFWTPQDDPAVLSERLIGSSGYSEEPILTMESSLPSLMELINIMIVKGLFDNTSAQQVLDLIEKLQQRLEVIVKDYDQELPSHIYETAKPALIFKDLFGVSPRETQVNPYSFADQLRQMRASGDFTSVTPRDIMSQRAKAIPRNF